MGIIRFAIDNPVKVAVLVMLVCLFGTLAVVELPRQLTPDMDSPIVTVETNWSGASPQEVESEIIDRQEEKLKSASGLKKMTAVARENSGTVELEFEVGVDQDIAFREVSEKLRQVTGYPTEVDEPTVTASDDDMSRTIAWLMLRGTGDVDVTELKTFAEERVKPVLERAEGIASVDVYGGREREMQVIVDPYRLAAARISARDVERALQRWNQNVSGGTINLGKRDYTYRTMGEFTSAEDVAEAVIAERPGGAVRVRDIGRVVDGFRKQFAFVRSQGEYVLALPCRRETGSNVPATMDRLKEQIRVVNAEILPTKHPDLRLEQTYDETIYIHSALDLVRNNIFLGGALTIVVLVVFLRSISATGIVALSIPISVMATFLTVAALGRTLNIVMLAGLAFAVGMVVDNSIVVLENTFRHRQMGKSRRDAAFDGAREVWGAVLAGTLTTMAVFVPVVFVEGETGQLFGDVAVAVSAAVGLSLVVAVVVIPPLAARMLGSARRDARMAGQVHWVVADRLGNAVAAINRRTWARLLVVVGMTAASAVGSYWLMPSTDYLPAGNKNLVFAFMHTPPGYSIEEFKRMAVVTEEGDPNDPSDGIRPFWEAATGSPEAARLAEVDMPVGEDGSRTVRVRPAPMDNFFFVSFGGGCFMGCTSKEDTNVSPLTKVLERAASRIPGVFSFASQFSLFGRGLSAGNSIELEVRGANYDKVLAAAGAILPKIMSVGLKYPQPDPPNFNQGRDEVRIVLDQERASDLGLDVADVGFIVEACANGAFVGEFNDRGERIDMVILFEGMQNATKEQVVGVPVYTPSGHVTPLASAVTLVQTTAPQQINHIEDMGSVKFTIQPPKGTPLQTAMEKVEGEVIGPLRAAGAIDSSVITAMAGNADKLTTTRRSLIGDFRGTMRAPAWVGGSAKLTLLAALATAGVIVVGCGAIRGGRSALHAAWMAGAVLVGGVLILNPDLALALIRSRAVLACAITYLLMAALFESFLYPFVIFISVPLAGIGALLALRLVHEHSLGDPTIPVQQFDVLTMLGFVILLGTVVNNAILVVHQALNYMREGGMNADEAVAESVRARTRPIAMTAVTTVVGMTPLVLMTGAGSELYRGIGAVVVGGLTFSTMFTLVVVPALFSLTMEWRAAIVGPASVRSIETKATHPIERGGVATGRPSVQHGVE